MLVLTRRRGEKIVIGNGITVTVVKVTRSQVRIGIDAPDQARILRGELACWDDVPAGSEVPTDPACPCGG